MPQEHHGATFEASDLKNAMFLGDAFVNCTFNGEALRCNFAKTSFTACTFAQGFKFRDCNLISVDGLQTGLVDGGKYSTPEEHAAEIQAQKDAGLLPANYSEESLLED